LDNEWIGSDYNVVFPDSTTTSIAYSIRIQPAPFHQIRLSIPSTNTAAPGLALSAMDTAIFIGDGGILFNNSGASAGNAISIVGKFKIANGGKYIHQTLRGNALLISNLVNGNETRKGVFEFNVPGNSAYTISASGRTFGSLVLSGQNLTRKTYTSSGSNKLTIEGDFIIKEQAGYSSSLTNNISIGGDMIIKGRLYINPVSGDTIGRCLESIGTNQMISISGLFNQGIHFRKWMINGSYKIHNSSITIEHPTGIMHIEKGSRIDLGNANIKGIGKVIIDSNTNIYTSASSIISADSMSNIQTTQLDIHQGVGFTCYGNILQSTGERFPVSISNLRVEKSNEKLFLTNSLQISDSLFLNKGIITMPDTAAITIGNYTSAGNDSSFVAGAVIQASKNKYLIFPLGVDSIFAPIQIIRNTDSLIHYALKASRFSSSALLEQIQYPVDKIILEIYWTISKSDTSNSDDNALLEIINYQNDRLSCIAALDTIDNKWKRIENNTTTQNRNSLSTSINTITSGIFTIGRLQQHVLPLNNIVLKKLSGPKEIILQWTVNDDENAQYYIIEQSKDGIHFELSDSVQSLKHKGKFTYKKSLQKSSKTIHFYKIRGVDIDGIKIYSNIVHDQITINSSTLYPNPGKNKMQLITKEKIIQMKIIHSNGKTNPIKFYTENNNYYLSVEHLSVGKYFLMIESESGIETISFMKQ
jgi:hypothetical protein